MTTIMQVSRRSCTGSACNLFRPKPCHIRILPDHILSGRIFLKLRYLFSLTQFLLCSLARPAPCAFRSWKTGGRTAWYFRAHLLRLLIRTITRMMITANAAPPAIASGISGLLSPVCTDNAFTTWKVTDFVTLVPSAFQLLPS